MRGLEYTVPASIIDLTIERIMEQQNSIGADVNEDPEDENEDRENVQISGEIVDAALDTEDVTAVINLLLERPSATDICSTENDNEVVNIVEVLAAGEENNNGDALPGDHHRQTNEYTTTAVEERDENEEESWAMGFANADLQDGALEPILDASVARPRTGKGVMFMILLDAEWELVRFHKSVNTIYQLYNVITNEWCESSLDSGDYGRMSQSSTRWIQFKSTAGR